MSSSQSTTPRRLIRARGPRSALGGLAPGSGMGLLRDNIVLAGRGASSVFSAPASASTPCGRLLLALADALRGASVLALGQNVSQASMFVPTLLCLRRASNGDVGAITFGSFSPVHSGRCAAALGSACRCALKWRIAPRSRWEVIEKAVSRVALSAFGSRRSRLAGQRRRRRGTSGRV